MIYKTYEFHLELEVDFFDSVRRWKNVPIDVQDESLYSGNEGVKFSSPSLFFSFFSCGIRLEEEAVKQICEGKKGSEKRRCLNFRFEDPMHRIKLLLGRNFLPPSPPSPRLSFGRHQGRLYFYFYLSRRLNSHTLQLQG